MILSLAVIGCIVPLVSLWPAREGTRDLRKMREGTMDSSGETMTRSGQILGMITTMLWIAVAVVGLTCLVLQTVLGQ